MSFLKHIFGGNAVFPANWTMPVKGEVKALREVPDPAFAEGSLGPGFAIAPNGGDVVSPVDGVITELFSTLHAVSIQADNGLEILIHIGVESMKLHGKGFTAHVSQGDNVYAGQTIISADWKELENAGLSTLVPVVFPNLHGKSVSVKNGRPELA